MTLNQITMIKLLFSLFITSCCIPFAHSQGLPDVKNHSWVTYLMNQANHSSIAMGMNSQFMKSGIGLDYATMNILPIGHIKIENKDAPADSFFVFNGIQYKTYDKRCPYH